MLMGGGNLRYITGALFCVVVTMASSFSITPAVSVAAAAGAAANTIAQDFPSLVNERTSLRLPDCAGVCAVDKWSAAGRAGGRGVNAKQSRDAMQNRAAPRWDWQGLHEATGCNVSLLG